MFFNLSDLADVEAKLLDAEQRCELHSVVIEECGEKLVAFPAHLCHPYYYTHMGLGRPELYVRERVASMYMTARIAADKEGYVVVLYDGYRDNSLQENLFLMNLARFTAPRMGLGSYFVGAKTPSHVQLKLDDLPQRTRQDLIRANTRYVALPSDDPQKVANHRTGGAVDVWLYKDGQPCDLGVNFDHMDEESHTFYHLLSDRRPWPTGGSDETVRNNREALLRFMLGAGFTVYPYEIWHYDFGNQRYARVAGSSAIYGIADSFLPS